MQQQKIAEEQAELKRQKVDMATPMRNNSLFDVSPNKSLNASFTG